MSKEVTVAYKHMLSLTHVRARTQTHRYGRVSHGWLGGDRFVNGTSRASNGTISSKIDSLQPEDRGITATIAQIGILRLLHEKKNKQTKKDR